MLDRSDLWSLSALPPDRRRYFESRVCTPSHSGPGGSGAATKVFVDGNIRKAKAMPVGLGVEDYPIVKSRLDRLRFENSCINEYLGRQKPGVVTRGFRL